MKKNDIFYKELLVFDCKRKKARKVSFQNGINIITSKKNSVGKSSLSLMLLYAFGAKVEFSDKWDLKDIYTKLTIRRNDRDIVIVRYRDTYTIISGEEKFFYPIQKYGYSDKLYDLLGLTIKIKDKDSESYSTAIPSLYLLPYYISQYKIAEERSVFLDLGMYNINDIRDAMYYHVGALDNKYSATVTELTQARERLDKLKKDNEKQVNAISYLKEKISSSKNIDVVDDDVELNSDIEAYDKFAEKNKEYYTLVKESLNIRRQIKLLNQSLKENVAYANRLLEEEEIICPECGSDITDFISSALNIGRAEADINAEIVELNSKLRDNERSKALLFRKLQELKKAVEEIEGQRDNVKSTRANIVWNDELKSVLDANRETLIELNKCEQDVKELSKNFRTYKSKKTAADAEYRNSFASILKSTNVSLNELNLNGIKLSQMPTLGGSEIPRVAISRFFALLESKANDSIGMPIIFDFPNLDMNEDNIALCFKVMCGKISDTSLYPQSFVFSIDCEERIGKAGATSILQNSNVIDFEKVPMDEPDNPQLLCEHDYVEYFDEINRMMDLDNSIQH